MIRIDLPSPRDAQPPSRGPAPGGPVDGASDIEILDGEAPRCPVRAGRPTAGAKAAAGIRGLKHAVRGDSSFFAHFYRTMLVALTAGLLGVGPWQWCLILLAATLILVAELTHSAVDTLARAVGDPESPGLVAAREIASASVLVAVVSAVAIYLSIFVLRFGDLFSWW